jgi:hypothetical protein
MNPHAFHARRISICPHRFLHHRFHIQRFSCSRSQNMENKNATIRFAYCDTTRNKTHTHTHTQLTDFLITGFTRGSTTPGSREPRRVARRSMPSRRRPALKNASRFLKVFRTRYIESVLARLIITKYRQGWGLMLRERSMSLSPWLPI